MERRERWLITRNLPPLLGGMERLNWHLLRSLSQAGRARAFGPAGAAAMAPVGTIVVESPLKPLPVFLLLSALRAIGSLWRGRPSLVLAGSGLTGPIAWTVARLSRARFAIYLHGLDIIAPSRLYQLAWLPFLRQADVVLVNSANTRRLAAERGIPLDRIHILHPGTDLPALQPDGGDVFRAAFGLGQSRLLLSVGRLTRRKGLAEFVRHALPKVVADWPDCRLVVVGGEAVDALHGHGLSERDRVMAAAREAGVEGHVSLVGNCDDALLGSAYQAAALHVFPVQDIPGDVEGFGMVALEAAAHGLRTAGFDVGGIADAVEHGVTGTLVPAGDQDALAEAVAGLLADPPTVAQREACHAFAAGKSWERFSERLGELLSLAPRA